MLGWLFRRKPAQDVGDGPPTLKVRVEDLERAFRGLEREWLDTLSQLNRLQGRLAKRVERAGGEPPPTGEAPGPPPPSGAMLAVLKRRSPRGVMPTGGG